MIKKIFAQILIVGVMIGMLLPFISSAQVIGDGQTTAVLLSGSNILGNWYDSRNTTWYGPNYFDTGEYVLPYPAPAPSNRIYVAPAPPSDAMPTVSTLPFKQLASPIYNFTTVENSLNCSYDGDGNITSTCFQSINYNKNVGPATEGAVSINLNGNYFNDQGVFGGDTGDGFVYIGNAYTQRPFTRSNAASVTERNLVTQAIYRDSKKVDVVISGTDTQEQFDTTHYQYGAIIGASVGTLPSYVAQVCVSMGESDCIQYETRTMEAIHQDGKTYFVDWNKTVNQAQGDPIYRSSTKSVQVTPATLISYVSPTNVVKDGQIIYMTSPVCSQGSSSSWFTTKVWVDCTTYGLSADGYVGTANYHKEDSSFGGWFGTFFIALPLAVADPIMFSAGGLGLPGIINLTPDVITQFAQMPSIWGTRQDSDKLGIGGWTWKGGWKVPMPSVDLKINGVKPQVNLDVPNTAATLSWTSKNTDSCQASPSWNGWTGAQPTSGSKDLGMLSWNREAPPTNLDHTFKLTCTGPGGSATDEVHAVVSAPHLPVVDLRINGAKPSITMQVPNTQATLAWTSQYADSCQATGDWSGELPVSGSRDLGKLARGTSDPGSGKTYTYGIACDGSEMDTSGTDTVKATVYEVPLCDFSATPVLITPPQASTLAWTCQYANTCSIDMGVGSVSAVGGTRTVRPSSSTLYTQTCKGIDGVVAPAAVVNVAGTPPVTLPGTGGTGTGSGASTGTGTVRIREVNP